ncbi:hypothetical protein RUM44_002442 [Polyplax serrata]|uniref:Uncharacterized protein n=1 Tax=Polyplax serrata TaxID=468196 RepID=A0ABR1AES7_POLSC
MADFGQPETLLTGNSPAGFLSTTRDKSWIREFHLRFSLTPSSDYVSSLFLPSLPDRREQYRALSRRQGERDEWKRSTENRQLTDKSHEKDVDGNGEISKLQDKLLEKRSSFPRERRQNDEQKKNKKNKKNKWWRERGNVEAEDDEVAVDQESMKLLSCLLALLQTPATSTVKAFLSTRKPLRGPSSRQRFK